MRMSIKFKLAAVFAAIMTLMIVLSAVAVVRFAHFHEALRHIVEITASKTLLASKLETSFLTVVEAQARLVLADDPEEMDRLHAEIKLLLSKMSEQRNQLTSLAGPEDLATLDNFDRAFAPFPALEQQISDLVHQSGEAVARELSQTDSIAALRTARAALRVPGNSLGNAAAARLDAALTRAREAETSALLAAGNIAQQANAQDAHSAAQSDAETALERLSQQGRISDTLTNAVTDYFETSTRAMELARRNTRLQARNLLTGQGARILSESKQYLDEMVARDTAEMESEAIATEALYQTSRMTVLLVTASTVLLGVIASIWMARSFSRGLNRALRIANEVGRGNSEVDCTPRSKDEIGDLLRAMGVMRTAQADMAAAANRIANGDLNVEVRPRSSVDQLGMSLQTMVVELRKVLTSANDSATTVASGSQSLSTTAEKLSQGATEQAAASEEASASMEEMSANIRQSADNAAQTEAIATQASSEARDSEAAVSEAVAAMKTIAERITIIQEIARQTDLLALNAAVEAARAGSHGKGFAVVASEVRKLAERSQTAASEIGELSSRTLDVSEKAGKRLAALLPAIQRTSDLVQEISAAMREQTIGADQINQSIRELGGVIQQNTTAANDAARVSQTLAEQSDRLLEIIANFTKSSDKPPAKPVSKPTKPTQKALKPPAGKAPPTKASPVAKAPATKPTAPPTPSSRPKAEAKEGGFALDLWTDEVPDSEFESIGKAS